MEKKTIKVNITDFYGDVRKDNNFYVNALKKYYNVEISEKPDFLFYSCLGYKHLNYDNCVKIFITGENVYPDFNQCDYGMGFDYIDLGDRYFHKNYRTPDISITDRTVVDDSFAYRKFCNFIYSNSTLGQGAALRQQFCQKLMEYKHVDCPGKVLNNMSAEDLEPRDGNWAKSKKEFLKKYKFTIAFENSLSNGYTTEKLIHPLQSFSIPIYWGNPLVTKDFNPKAFINCNDYDNDLDAVIERIKELDNDPDKYLAMLRENPMQPDYDFDNLKKFEEWIVNIVKKGNKPFDKGAAEWTTTYKLQRDLKNMEKELSAYKELEDDLKDIFVTARIDVSSPLQEEAPFVIENQKPAEWMKKFKQYGYVIEKFGKKTNFTVKACRDAKLRIALLGQIPKIINNERVGQWVTYNSVLINGNEILKEPVSAWHDKPYSHVIDMKEGEKYDINIVWSKYDKGKNV